MRREIHEPIKKMLIFRKKSLTIIHPLLLSKATDHRRPKKPQDNPYNRENKKMAKTVAIKKIQQPLLEVLYDNQQKQAQLNAVVAS